MKSQQYKIILINLKAYTFQNDTNAERWWKGKKMSNKQHNVYGKINRGKNNFFSLFASLEWIKNESLLVIFSTVFVEKTVCKLLFLSLSLAIGFLFENPLAIHEPLRLRLHFFLRDQTHVAKDDFHQVSEMEARIENEHSIGFFLFS
jgi:hypothetical protein